MMLTALVLGAKLLSFECEMDSLPGNYELRQTEVSNCKASGKKQNCHVTYELSEINGDDFWILEGSEVTTLSFEHGAQKKIVLNNKEVSVALESQGDGLLYSGTFSFPNWSQRMKCDLH